MVFLNEKNYPVHRLSESSVFIIQLRMSQIFRRPECMTLPVAVKTPSETGRSTVYENQMSKQTHRIQLNLPRRMLHHQAT